MTTNRFVPIGPPGQRTSRNEGNENREIRQAVFWFFVGTEGLMSLACALFFVPKLSGIMAAIITAAMMGTIIFIIHRIWGHWIVPWTGLVLMSVLATIAGTQGSELYTWLVGNLEFLLVPLSAPVALAFLLLTYCMGAEAVDRNGPTPPRNAVSWGGVIWPWTRIPSQNPWSRPSTRNTPAGQFSLHVEGSSRGDYQSVMEDEP